jgi:hypothetical protein
MPLASGLGSQFGLAKETVYGTVVTPAKFFEFDSESMNLDITYQESVGLRAGRTFQPAARTFATTRQAGGGVTLDVPTKGFGSILDLMHGLTVAPVQQGATAAYLQTHAVGTSQPNKSATTQFNKPTSAAVDTPFTYPGSVLTAASFSLDLGGILKAALTWDSRTSRPRRRPGARRWRPRPTRPASRHGTTPRPRSPWTAAPVGTATALTATWTQPYKEDRFFLNTSGVKGKPIPNGFATVEGTISLEFNDATAYSLWRSGRKDIAVVFDFVGATIASTYKEQITFTMPAVQVRGESPQVGGPDVLEVSAPFKALDNGSAAPLTIAYQSTDVTI